MSPAATAVAARAASEAVAARQPSRPAPATPSARRRELRVAAAVQAAWLADLL